MQHLTLQDVMSSLMAGIGVRTEEMNVDLVDGIDTMIGYCYGHTAGHQLLQWRHYGTFVGEYIGYNEQKYRLVEGSRKGNCMLIEKGITMKEVARRLNVHGIKARAGKKIIHMPGGPRSKADAMLLLKTCIHNSLIVGVK